MSGLSQDPLWEEPSWTTRWPVGTKVRSTHTDNEGVVVSQDHLGRHLMIRWNAWRSPWVEREPYTVRHSSELGLERL